MSAQCNKVVHPFAPVYDERSRILILGSFPSVVSRQQKFYYGNPRNRFWQVLADLTSSPLPVGIEERTRFLLDRHIAVWDVLASCEIQGSADATITREVPNDLHVIFETASIEGVFANGRAAWRFYQKHHGKDITCLPSTSPANAAYSLARLEQAWSVIVPFLHLSH